MKFFRGLIVAIPWALLLWGLIFVFLWFLMSSVL